MGRANGSRNKQHARKEQSRWPVLRREQALGLTIAVFFRHGLTCHDRGVEADPRCLQGLLITLPAVGGKSESFISIDQANAAVTKIRQ